MTRADAKSRQTGGLLGPVLAASPIALTRHTLPRSAPPGLLFAQLCKMDLCLRKCLSMPPTLRKLALLWLMETRSKNLTLNQRINAS